MISSQRTNNDPIYKFVFDGNAEVGQYIHEGYPITQLLTGSRMDRASLRSTLSELPANIVAALRGSLRNPDGTAIDDETFKAVSSNAGRLSFVAIRRRQPEPITDMSEVLANSNLIVPLSTVAGTRQISLSELIQESFASEMAVIFTFTPGPFKTTDQLPPSWKTTSAALGCTLQLKKFEDNYARLNAIVININEHSADYQAGAEGLIKNKGLDHLQMISDESHEIEKLLNLGGAMLAIDGQKYFPRFSIALTKDGRSKFSLLQSPVTEEIADQHIAEMEEFINQPQLRAGVEMKA